MRTRFALAVIIAVLTGNATSFGQGSASLKGVWRVTEMAMTGPNARTFTPSGGYWVFTDKYFSRVEIRSDKPRPTMPPKPTVEDFRAQYDPLVVNFGTYEVGAGTLTILPELGSRASSAGISATYAITVDAKSLTAKEVRTARGPYPNPTTFTLTRVE